MLFATPIMTPSRSEPASSPQPSRPDAPAAAASPPTSSTASYSPLMRQVREFGLFFAGASFLAASIAVSRRSVLRRRFDTLPPFHTSNRHTKPFDGSDRVALATQALGLATLNVMSFGIMLTGGISWAFDLCSVEELRERTQAVVRRPGKFDPEAEKEMEDMMKSLLDKLGMDSTLPEKSKAEDEKDEPPTKS
ncbi:hypothetical protein JDV02_010132 [Purpureocillium takamizusanense]|uniref:Altered inheritance of mitochondria protein 11 n=1 Tax=Purpureocillium takamizusanense TaxID=2060973 RepID=A0A9Q8VGC2_9HYPO|nr:uncharacterized protein JDV02_010132 [Purpureocillium takamizusanense]UNI24381.1 hypothetical protein JDV02_010132 [Purpureocillium takamizusanense]